MYPHDAGASATDRLSEESVSSSGDFSGIFVRHPAANSNRPPATDETLEEYPAVRSRCRDGTRAALSDPYRTPTERKTIPHDEALFRSAGRMCHQPARRL